MAARTICAGVYVCRSKVAKDGKTNRKFVAESQRMRKFFRFNFIHGRVRAGSETIRYGGIPEFRACSDGNRRASADRRMASRKNSENAFRPNGFDRGKSGADA